MFPVPLAPREQIRDLTEQDLVNLRRTIYLTIMSSAGFEECAHKLMKLDIREGYEMVSRASWDGLCWCLARGRGPSLSPCGTSLTVSNSLVGHGCVRSAWGSRGA